MNDINWREELLDSAKFNKKEENLLRHGAKSLAQSWHLGALYIRWKKLKGYRNLRPLIAKVHFLNGSIDLPRATSISLMKRTSLIQTGKNGCS